MDKNLYREFFGMKKTIDEAWTGEDLCNKAT